MIEKVPIQRNSMSLGILLLEKLFKRTQTQTPQSDESVEIFTLWVGVPHL